MTTAEQSPVAVNNGAPNNSVRLTEYFTTDQAELQHGTAKPIAVLARETTCAFIEALRQAGTLHTLTPTEAATGLRNAINRAAMAQNAVFNKERKPTHPDHTPFLMELGHMEVAALMTARHRVVNITPTAKNSDPDLDMLAIYDDDPTSESFGTYLASHTYIRRLARGYWPNLKTKDFTELLAALTDEAPRVQRGRERDLVPVRNGIFDYATKELRPFTPDQVFISKLAVDYVADPPLPLIDEPDGGVWDVESWMRSLSDDEEVVHLLWQIIGAVTRPYVRWNRAAFFYSEEGNNGKGTLLELMRTIAGPQGYASVAIADFGKDFMLEPLTRANSVLVDENDVGAFIDKAANLKAVITNDVISMNRKYKTPIAFQFYGFMVQCLNGKPQVKDNSQSFWRRQIIIEFTKNFTGAERKYIKEDFLTRPAVLEYILHRVLHMEYYQLSEPEATRLTLGEFKDANDPVRVFWDELKDDFAWDLLPFAFLFDLYRVWLARVNPSSTPLGRNKFIDRLVAVVNEHRRAGDLTWVCEDKRKQYATGTHFVQPEYLIDRYGLKDWMDQTDNAPRKQRCTPPQTVLANAYRGITRTTPVHAAQSMAVAAGLIPAAPDGTAGGER